MFVEIQLLRNFWFFCICTQPTDSFLLRVPFLPNSSPEVVVLFEKLFVEPVVDDRVAEVVDVGQVDPLIV